MQQLKKLKQWATQQGLWDRYNALPLIGFTALGLFAALGWY